MDYKKALACLKHASAAGPRMGLERVTELLHRLGDPQEQVKIIHIAGTNGKGSVGAVLSSVLTAAGYRTGHFVSPALTCEREYFRICGQEITEERFAALFTQVAERAAEMADPPTEFELLSAMAYTWFAQEACGIAVVECCMGGDTDCTNVLRSPLLSVITNVQLDHQSFLGNTAAEIAAHKAGIIKPGCPVLFDAEHSAPEALPVIRDRAELLGAPLHLLREALTEVEMTLQGTAFRFQGRDYRIPLLGSHQLRNVCIVLHALALLTPQIPEAAVRRGLEAVRWHGRFELLSSDPVVIYDGAHNPDGIRCAAGSIRQYFGGQSVLLLTGVMADKDFAAYPALLGVMTERVFAVRPDNPRSLEAARLAAVYAEAGIPAEAYASVEAGTAAALACAKETGKPLIVLGSLYLYREFCEAFRRLL